MTMNAVYLSGSQIFDLGARGDGKTFAPPQWFDSTNGFVTLKEIPSASAISYPREVNKLTATSRRRSRPRVQTQNTPAAPVSTSQSGPRNYSWKGSTANLKTSFAKTTGTARAYSSAPLPRPRMSLRPGRNGNYNLLKLAEIAFPIAVGAFIGGPTGALHAAAEIALSKVFKSTPTSTTGATNAMLAPAPGSKQTTLPHIDEDDAEETFADNFPLPLQMRRPKFSPMLAFG